MKRSIENSVGGSITTKLTRGATPSEVVAAAGGGAVALSALDDIIASFANGPGYLRDMRDNTSLFVDNGELTPVVNTGDLVGEYKNQCTVTGADVYSMNESTTSVKAQWVDGQGVTSQTNLNFIRADNNFVSIPGTRFDTLTTVFAVKASVSTTEINSRVIGSQNSYYNVIFRALGDGTFAIQPYLSQTLGDIAVTGDANDVFVVMTQWQPDNTLDVYVNNVLVGSPSLAAVAWLAGQQANFNFSFFAAQDNTQEFVLGWAIVPGIMDADQRQTYCDYFQQNGGVL